METGASGKKALVVVDMLNDFVRPGAPLEVPETRTILPALRRRIAKARRDGELVVYVCDSHRKNDPEFARMGWPPHAVEGTPGARGGSIRAAGSENFLSLIENPRCL